MFITICKRGMVINSCSAPSQVLSLWGEILCSGLGILSKQTAGQRKPPSPPEPRHQCSESGSVRIRNVGPDPEKIIPDPDPCSSGTEIGFELKLL
jgi:hypothetical protein